MKPLLQKLIFSITLGLSPWLQAAEPLAIQADIEALKLQKMAGILVQQHNQLLYEQYFNGSSARALHDIRSASKSVTSLLFGMALQQQLFTSEQDLVLPVFADYQPLLFATKAKTAMTFFQLLSMTNPLECNDWTEYSAGNEERMYLQADWLSFVLNLPERGHAPWEKAPADQPYGRDFAYCTAGVFLTGAAIERKTKMKLSDYAQQQLFTPLGIHEVSWPYSPKGLIQGGGGLKIKAPDLLKIGQLMLNKGQWQGKSLVSADWLQKSFTPYSEAMSEMHADYGLTWWIFSYPINGKTIKAYAAAGNGGNYLFVIPAYNATVVTTSSAYNTHYMHRQIHQLMQTVILPALSARSV